MSDQTQDTKPENQSEQTDFGSQPDQRFDQDRDSIELALRFLVGLLAIGGDEAARRLQEMQRKLNENPALWTTETSLGDKSLRRQAWHLGVGLIRRGQRRLRRELRRGFELSLGTADRAASSSTQWASNRLPSPVRDALGARLVQWRAKAALIIQEGEMEEQKGRALATGALSELITEIMDEVAKNPDLQEFVQDMVGQQGIGMATSVADNARSVTLTADDAAEGLLRWLFRRTPRRELPPSPVEGQPQTMYTPTAKVEGEVPDAE